MAGERRQIVAPNVTPSTTNRGQIAGPSLRPLQEAVRSLAEPWSF